MQSELPGVHARVTTKTTIQGSILADPTTYPYSSVVRVSDTIGGKGWLGSGVLISPDEVLTAAHVVWTSGVGVATDVQVQPGYTNGTSPFGSLSGNVTHYFPIDDTGGLISFTNSQSDYAIIHLSAPTTAGFMAIGSGFTSGTAIESGYPGYSGKQVEVSGTFTKMPFYSLLTGPMLGEGSSGGPVWTGDASNATVVGTVSTGDNLSGYFNQITPAERSMLQAWVAQDDGYASIVGYIDTKTGVQGSAPLTVSSGGPSYLNWQYIWSSPDGVALSSSAPNVFLHGGAGQDSIQVTAGQNILDGGAGSNFLTGGTGTDTFFTDARGTAVVWNTLRNFHSGDAATLWGFVPGVSSYTWDSQTGGAPGSEGATLRANIVGGSGRAGDGIDASITFTGMSMAQAQSLQLTTGSQNAGSYLFLFNPGV